MVAAIAVENSKNAKLGATSATYASQASCPGSCPLQGAGCYAEYGPLGYQTARLNRSPITDPMTIALEEAAAIDRLSGDRLLRLHVVGDCPTPASAQIVTAACRAYAQRGMQPRHGKKVWSYTHAWRDVARKDWGQVSILASCETPAQVRRAMRKGYAAALIVPEFASDKLYSLGGLKILPCPWQTRGVQCYTCRLCLDDTRLRKARIVIGFQAHGARKNVVRQTLKSLEVIS